MKNKINASVAILTLNSADTLDRCLQSVREFAEIVICDGNSTDDTIKIAKKFQAIIVPQFASKKKNQKITDKAKIRNKALDATTKEWHFWLDSDDELSTELIDEIRTITQSSKPSHLIYRVPLRHVIANKIIKYSSNYPLYQERLFHKSTGARFDKPTHERIKFDKTYYSVGTLDGYYNIHWSKERADHFYETIDSYLAKELKDNENDVTWQWYKRWILGFHIPVLLGMSVRMPFQYIQHGFKDTMAPHIEYHRYRKEVLMVLGYTAVLARKYMQRGQ